MTPILRWAYLTYQATDNLAISAGRLRLPLFRYSSSLDVGYSYHWIAPPESVYDVAFNNLDGIRLDYSNYAGDWEYNIQLAAGTYENENEVFSIEGKDVLAGTVEATYDYFKVRAVYGRAKSTFTVFQLEPLFAQLQPILPPSLFDNLAAENDTGKFPGSGTGSRQIRLVRQR